MKATDTLFRYTSLPFLLDYLERQKLVLLNPDGWEDKNDTEILKAYVRKKKLAKVLALCFTKGTETLHHWKAFSHGTSGCRIEFKADQLIGILDTIPHIKYRNVAYKRIGDTRNNIVAVDEYPFTKRTPFAVEKEFRIIKDCNSLDETFEIAIPQSCVRRITFAYQLPRQVFEVIKEMLVAKYGIAKSKICLSTMYKNKTWLKNLNGEEPE